LSAFTAPPFGDELLAALLDLNNDHAKELALETEASFRDLLAAASHVRAASDGLALLIAFNETCTYDSPNFAWLTARYPRFNYIDRVVVSEKARGRGLARLLYEGLERETLAQSRERLVCEVNLNPPNPASDAFHSKLGFRPVGEQRLADRNKTVRYWAKELG
jgi:predicted GNAT superfamily acetyltransferase